MIKRIKILSSLLVVAVLVLGYSIFSQRAQSPVQPVTSGQEQTIAPPQVKGQQSFFYAGIKGETAMSLLKLYHKVETKDFGDLGEMVVAIDGIKPAADEFWAFYVNGKSSTIGASSYKTKDNDQIEWRLETITE
ncbi:MAG: hypothetical protein A2722_00060 [Candidatus Doudnabacteria bacterium RIFCSPHIGHO2_01_FULL_50_11]|uniref:Transcobalamin-like C-terminal domain-containing protein n=1 Tax=Candidatus Doudnabacteria bacterium RIFCSPHIGHO2_01_FULL_50_11 TaxID=1817828 RepID=A0A1F5PJ11_9BACT|nr:MAG: hypothetical protein A2722_00060 [Candidatus Doudnabacteria bacterium RIFCSPHIGHO2_01_FULL_50_11]HLC44364.1 DUF4430 domain-containing protein [Patescibacteria group bacterium]